MANITTYASLANMVQLSETAQQIENQINNMRQLKEKIEELSNFHQIEVLRILHDAGITLNENKNGVFINITYLPENVVEKITEYLKYVNSQEYSLNEVEVQKETLRKEFFTDIWYNTNAIRFKKV